MFCSESCSSSDQISCYSKEKKKTRLYDVQNPVKRVAESPRMPCSCLSQQLNVSLLRASALTEPNEPHRHQNLHEAQSCCTETHRAAAANSRMLFVTQNKTNCILYCYSHKHLTCLEADHLTSGVSTVFIQTPELKRSPSLFVHPEPSSSRACRCYRTRSDVMVHIMTLRSVCF